MAKGEGQERSSSIHHSPFTIHRRLSPPRDVPAGEAAGAAALWRAGRVGQGDVLHAELREDHFEELLLLADEVAARLAVERAQHVDALLGELEVDAAAARVVDHAERVGRERGEELDEHQEALVALRLARRLGRRLALGGAWGG